ncbi:hypothetical protein LguiB_030223 [Lonicera macranthoides]
MNTDGASSNTQTSRGKMFWTPDQDAKLVDCLHELNIGSYWKVDCSFRTGYLQELEKMLEQKLPRCGLKAVPNIESRVKTLKKHTLAIAEMLNQGSGFAWDDLECQVKSDADVFKTWCQSHKDARGLRNKPFPHYNVLIEIYGKDRANGDGAIDPQEEEDVIRANFHCLDDDEILPNDGLDGIEVSSTQEYRTPSTNRGRGTKRKKVTDGFNASLGDMASSFKKFVECTNANLDKLANGLYVNHENELGKKVVDELSNMEGLDEEDVIKAANIIVGDGPKCSLLFALKPSMKVTWVLKLIGKLP